MENPPPIIDTTRSFEAEQLPNVPTLEAYTEDQKQSLLIIYLADSDLPDVTPNRILMLIQYLDQYTELPQQTRFAKKLDMIKQYILMTTSLIYLHPIANEEYSIPLRDLSGIGGVQSNTDRPVGIDTVMAEGTVGRIYWTSAGENLQTFGEYLNDITNNTLGLIFEDTTTEGVRAYILTAPKPGSDVKLPVFSATMQRVLDSDGNVYEDIDVFSLPNKVIIDFPWEDQRSNSA